MIDAIFAFIFGMGLGVATILVFVAAQSVVELFKK